MIYLGHRIYLPSCHSSRAIPLGHTLILLEMRDRPHKLIEAHRNLSADKYQELNVVAYGVVSMYEHEHEHKQCIGARHVATKSHGWIPHSSDLQFLAQNG